MSDVIEITKDMEKELSAMGKGNPDTDEEITKSVTEDGDM